MAEEKTMGRNKENMFKWRADNLRRYEFYVNTKTDADVCEWLDSQPNKRQYLIALIKGDMNENRHPTDEEN